MSQNEDKKPQDETVLDDLEQILDEIPKDEEEGAAVTSDDELADLKEQLARAQADYVNLSRRSSEEKIQMGTYMKKQVIGKILPILDNMERASEHVPAEFSENDWTKGILSIVSSLSKELEGFGVKAFDSVGQEVDPDRHDVLSQGPGEEGKIVNEFEKGYTIGEEILRHAKVVVGNGE